MSEGSRPSAMRIVEMLDLADRTVEACLTRVVRSEGVSREQWRTLMLLAEGTATDGSDAPGHTMGEIAARAAVPSPTATRIVDKLVADGLVFRRADPWDRRRVLVHISGQGHALVTRAAAALDDAFGSALTDLPTSDALGIRALLDRLGAAAADAPTGARSS